MRGDKIFHQCNFDTKMRKVNKKLKNDGPI